MLDSNSNSNNKSHPTGDTGTLPVRRSGRVPKKRVGLDLYEPEWDVDPFDDNSHRRQKKLLKLALAKSIVDTKFVKTKPLPSAKVFRPTIDEFADPIQYITR